MYGRIAVGSIAAAGSFAAYRHFTTEPEPEPEPKAADPNQSPTPVPRPNTPPDRRAPRGPQPIVDAATAVTDLRVATLNVHELVPAGVERSDATESAAALRDVAAWINEQDPDVVVFQELDEDDLPVGLGSQLGRLAALTGGVDTMMAGRFSAGSGNLNDNAIMTRNGVRITQADHAKLQQLPDGTGRRSVGIVELQAPSGTSATVLFTHLNAGAEGELTQRQHLAQIAKLARDAASTGTLSYTSRDGNRPAGMQVSPDAPVIFMGDLNAPMELVDRHLRAAGAGDLLTNTMRAPGIRDKRADAASFPKLGTRIDHVYTEPQVLVRDTWVAPVRADAVLRDGAPGVAPTDHHGVLADLRIQS